MSTTEESKRLVVTLKFTQAEYEKLQREAKEQTRSCSAQIMHYVKQAMGEVR